MGFSREPLLWLQGAQDAQEGYSGKLTSLRNRCSGDRSDPPYAMAAATGSSESHSLPDVRSAGKFERLVRRTAPRSFCNRSLGFGC
jgi:hypothetical protein